MISELSEVPDLCCSRDARGFWYKQAILFVAMETAALPTGSESKFLMDISLKDQFAAGRNYQRNKSLGKQLESCIWLVQEGGHKVRDLARLYTERGALNYLR